MILRSIAYLAFVGLFLHCQAFPSNLSLYTSSELGKRDSVPIPEWTAMGDSYASGVGAGTQPLDEMNRCLRFPNAYPIVLQAGFKPKPSNFNNVVCSGLSSNEIKDKELLDVPKEDGKRGLLPAWGKAPEFVTFTAGGNDIGILNLIATCMVSFKLWGDTCEQVIKSANDKMKSQKFKDDIDGLIKAIIDKGRGTSVGDRFELFVVGYAQFFNQETTQCNGVTFKPKWNFLPAQYLTIERRKGMNSVAVGLNKALSDAVDRFKDKGVYWVDYDKAFDTHRFCDRTEPNPNDPETWFFSYYTTQDPNMEAAQRIFQKLPAYQASIQGKTDSVLKTDQDYINALREAAKDELHAESAFSDLVRIFHPTTRGHAKIKEVVLKALNDQGIPRQTTAQVTPQPPKCHGVSGDTWMLSREQAVSASEQFCKQDRKDSESFP